MTVFPASAEIRAACPWNDTGIDLAAGTAYRLVAVGTWHDKSIDAGPDGIADPVWGQRLAARWLRAPGERYFTLIGALDRDPATLFRIGAGTPYTPPRAGRLTCFANDVPGFYGNNSGAVLLTVVRP